MDYKLKLRTPKICIFLGSGGVGKTTLSASYALSLAHQGYIVGLLSVDPAQRLHQALRLDALDDEGTTLSIGSGTLHVSQMNLDESLERWIKEQNISIENKKKLLSNPCLKLLKNRMATSLESLAGIRIAEWCERFPNIQYLVVDTAPGIHGLELLLKPQKLIHFLESPFLSWMKLFAHDQSSARPSFLTKVVRSGSQKILSGLGTITGNDVLHHFGDFLSFAEPLFDTALRRLNFIHKQFQTQSVSFYLVSAPRDDALSFGQSFLEIFEHYGLTLSKIILNKCLFLNCDEQGVPFDLGSEFFSQELEKNQEAQKVQNFLKNYLNLEKKVHAFFALQKKLWLMPYTVFVNENQKLHFEKLIAVGNIMSHPGL